MTNRFAGKYFSIIGDSISTFEGYIPEGYAIFYTYEAKEVTGVKAPEETWWWQVIEHFGGILLVNNSWSGSLTCALPEFDPASCGCGDARMNALGRDGISPDHIIIFMGTNDRGFGRPVSSEDKDDLTVLENAYDLMLRKIKTNHPHTVIWCCTLPDSVCLAHPENPLPSSWNAPSAAEYAEAVKRLAAQNGSRVIHLCGNGTAYDSIDGVHPNADGMATLARAIIAEMEKY